MKKYERKFHSDQKLSFRHSMITMPSFMSKVMAVPVIADGFERKHLDLHSVFPVIFSGSPMRHIVLG